MKQIFVFIYAAFVLALPCTNLIAQMLRQATTLKHKGYAEIIRLNAVNSPFNERNPSITPDGKYLFFMSERGGQVWSRKKERPGTEAFDGDIWYATLKNNDWEQAMCLSQSVNSARGEDEPIISFDGRTVVFQSWRDGWQQNGGPYYFATIQNIIWSNPIGLGGGIHDFFAEKRRTDSVFATDGATISLDGGMFIVAAGPQYDGDMDLFFSTKSAGGSWSYPRPLPLNTEHNERSAFLAADGQTLYFASDGYEGFGGLDIYKATLMPDGSIRHIVNLGEPFNTKADDYGFVLTASGDEAYFVRNGDLYRARLSKEFSALKPMPMVMLKGVTKNKQTNGAIEARIELRELPAGQTLSFTSNSSTGEYAIPLKPGKHYEQVCSAPDYMTQRRKFFVPAYRSKTFKPIQPFDILLQHLTKP